MIYIIEPKVFVTGKLLPHWAGLDDFLWSLNCTGERIDRTAPPMETMAAIGARTCYQSYDRGRPHPEHIANLVASQHGSCLEHVVWQVVVTGISRSCGQQWIRHRHLSPSQESQRYCRYTPADARIVVPPAYLQGYRERRDGVPSMLADEFHAWAQTVKSSLILYTRRCGATKASREAARSLLPECLETKICFTGNARAWRNVFERRCSPHADAEIRRATNAVYLELIKDAPNVFGDYTKTELDDGTFSLRTEHRGV